jgi:hypothetical protein
MVYYLLLVLRLQATSSIALSVLLRLQATRCICVLVDGEELVVK